MHALLRPRALGLAVLALLACGDRREARPTSPPDATYTVEGRIERLPREGADRAEISVAHEPIPTFRDREGQEVGMEAMTMQFGVAPDVPLSGVAVGDRVRLTFEVRWEGRPMLLVTALEKL